MVQERAEVRSFSEMALASAAGVGTQCAAVRNRLQRPPQAPVQGAEEQAATTTAPPTVRSFSDAVAEALQMTAEIVSVRDRYCAIATALWRSTKVVCTLHHAVPSQRSWCTLGDPYLVVHTASESGRESLLRTEGSGFCIRSHVTVIDLCFKDRYQIARSTPEYADFHSRLPSVFVGTYEQLATALTVVADQMLQSFSKAGIDTIPPWRTLRAMRLSYWYRDTAVVREDELPDPRLAGCGSD
eukprot:TRINITY_DN21019_c0_g1_i2.p1 TRINITY_DN21019_c0_g1~~TRINITY_DN21019_c0_g1_i2.p1  ORF type:complete len:242 (+),score=82.15 TRINITY_DN21019_c0_g1_i2:96-821(+)